MSDQKRDCALDLHPPSITRAGAPPHRAGPA
jgi:hypothetical protein